MPRGIIHVDMDAFFASVEQRDDPSLRGKPVIVGAPRDMRGVVSTCSYEARKFGVHSAMPSRTAAQLCPHAIFVKPDMKRYAEASRKVMAILERFTPYVEQVSVDEAYLDVTGSRRQFGTPLEIATAIRKAVRDELDLPCSAGVATSKSVAKICSDLAKPNGLKAAPEDPDALRDFLLPLPVGWIRGVDKTLAPKLERSGIRTIGDIQRAPHELLVKLVGDKHAPRLRTLAFGADTDEVCAEAERELSISREFTFGEDSASYNAVRDKLRELADEVGEDLRRSGRSAYLVRIKLRWSDFTTITRQRKYDRAVRDNFTLFERGAELLDSEKLVDKVRLVGFGVGDLADGDETKISEDLFSPVDGTDALRKKREIISDTLDAIHAKLGTKSIGRWK